MNTRLFRHILIQSNLFLSSISNGLIFGQTSGMVAAFISNDENLNLTHNDISWIASTINLSAMLGIAAIGFFTDRLGRRKGMTIASTLLLINWVILYFAKTLPVIMVSRVLGGTAFGGIIMLLCASTGEYTSPKYRGILLYVNTSIGPAVGAALGHLLGIILHWRTVAMIGTIPAVIHLIVPFFCVESPSWLASKGKFKECEESFKKLHNHIGSDKELKLLIEVESLKRIKTSSQSFAGFNIIAAAIKRVYFWKIFVLSSFISLYMVGTGKILFSVYAANMMEDVTGKSDILLYTLLVDAFCILGSCIAVYLVKIMKMRTLLFSSGILANVLLVSLSACLYYLPKSLSFTSWLNSMLLGLYFVVINAGPYAALEALTGEVYPLEIKETMYALGGVLACTLMFVSVLIAPSTFALIGYYGVFLALAVISLICQIYLWFYLPETKGRTLQEIELFFKNNKFDKIDGTISGDQIKVLV